MAIYVDDTIIYISLCKMEKATEYLQKHLNNVYKCFLTWKLKINSEKTQAITFTRKLIKSIAQIFTDGHNIS